MHCAQSCGLFSPPERGNQRAWRLHRRRYAVPPRGRILSPLYSKLISNILEKGRDAEKLLPCEGSLRQLQPTFFLFEAFSVTSIVVQESLLPSFFLFGPSTMAVDKDLEAFVDFLQERGVPVLKALENLDLEQLETPASGSGDGKGGSSGSAPTAAAAEPSSDGPGRESGAPSSSSQPAITKEAIVSTFLRLVSGSQGPGVGGGRLGGDGSRGVSGGASGGESRKSQLNAQPLQQQPWQPPPTSQQQSSSSNDANQAQLQQKGGEEGNANHRSNPSSQHGGNKRPHEDDDNNTQEDHSAGTRMVLRSKGSTSPVDPRVASGLSGVRTFNRLPGPVIRTCQHEGCARRPSFNHPGQRAKFCSAHRELNMVDVAHKVRCQKEVCRHNREEKKRGISSSFLVACLSQGYCTVLTIIT